ncbi:MAG: hypothetical protein M3336_13765, partial [Chloroflexota bacterium]|nr:hypothetical protein [Chloroflexota bacterium]
VINGATQAFNERVDAWVDELKQALGAPSTGRSTLVSRAGAGQASNVVERQMSGVDQNAQRGSTGQFLSIDQPVQDSGAVGTRSPTY